MQAEEDVRSGSSSPLPSASLKKVKLPSFSENASLFFFYSFVENCGFEFKPGLFILNERTLHPPPPHPQTKGHSVT